MVTTSNYEVVAEVTKGVLQQILEGAWDQSIIPHSFDISAGLMFGPYQVADGVVNIPKVGLNLDMSPGDNGIRLKLPSQIMVEIANPPIPSAKLFNMNADVFAVVPIGTLQGTINVGAILQGLPRSKVSATLTSGDPVGPIKLSMIQEYVHQKYLEGVIPQTYTEEQVNYGIFTADVFVMIYDDPSDSNHQILVSEPTPNQVKLSIPIYLRLSNMSASIGPQPLSPMAVEARIILTAPLEAASGSVKAKLTQSTVDVESMVPASGVEGTNYTMNKAGASLLGINLDDILTGEMKARGQAIVAAIGDVVITVPAVSQIEGFIADQAHAAIVNRGNISIWTPQIPGGSGVSVSNVAVKVLADALAICLNDMGGADPNSITTFIPAGRSCAININGNKVLQIIDETIHRPESEGGFGPNFPPKTFDNVDGHQAVLNSLSISLTDGSIHMEGDVTVIDALPCGVDVDASFEAEVGLTWEDNADGTQTIKPYMIGEPDVDLSLLAWILSFLLGFITLGLVGGIIALVVVDIAEGIAERIGGGIIKDQVTSQIKMIGAWPQQLEGIGTIKTRFENPVDIDSDSVIFPDAFLVIATYALTVDALAKANGPYIVDGGSLLQFTGGPVAPDTDYLWNLGDGPTVTGIIVSHTYGDDGIYVAKLTTKVNQPGGSRTREFASIRVRNVPPKVEVGPDMTVNEGQEVEYIATFMDPEWLDKHRAYFNFGDDSLPVKAPVNETNNMPQAQGTARAKHAYCREGKYTVTVQVIDDDGGVGKAVFHVESRNVAPIVEAGEDMFAYVCTPITLVAHFTDPGWCDKHKGSWSFGDSTPPLPATIRESNNPPAATGRAAATHIYSHCGNFLAECVVNDEGGGTGRDTTIVRVVSLLNGDFEDGFHVRSEGTVANHWKPYVFKAGVTPVGVTAKPTTGEGMSIFAAEEFVVQDGQRSQRISLSGEHHAGIYQSVGANLHWDYQVSTWYHQYGGSKCRLGIDPTGSTDPASSNIIWSEGEETHDWTQIAVRVTAMKRSITIFLEASSVTKGASAWFDSVMMTVSPCELKEKPAPPPQKEKERCVGWSEEKKPRRVGTEFTKEGFVFKSSQPLQIVTWGSPPSQGKLLIPSSGLKVLLPFMADRILAHVAQNTQKAIIIEALDETGKNVGHAETAPIQGKIHALEILAANISVLLFTSSGEDVLIDLCEYGKASAEPRESMSGREGSPQVSNPTCCT